MTLPSLPPPVSRRTLLAGAAGVLMASAGCRSGGPEQVTPADPSGPSSSTTSVSPRTGSPTSSPAASPSTAGSPTASPPTASSRESSPSATASSSQRPRATDAEIAARATVPVLCWHQLRDWTSSDGGYARNLLICPPAKFRAQLDTLAEDGWHTISPDQYLDHLTTGKTLPAKPVLLSFDDSQGTQITEGLPQLQARDMTATFFAMTVVLGNPGWFTKRDLKRLDAAGMTVAAHSWDHQRVDRYSGTDWARQLQQPRELLERIIGGPVEHFAYPYGAWDRSALPHVQAAGYRSAYQLADRKPANSAPLYTLRRDLVTSTWTPKQLRQHLKGLTR